MSTENEYIQYRKKIAKDLSNEFYKNQKLYSIQRNKIVFSTFEGDGGFCCNPRYIAEELNADENKYEMVWLTRNKNSKFPSYIRTVENTPENIAYELSTAKVWIDNYRKPMGTLKREGQMYIQTWHASIGFKAVGLYRGKAFPEIARLVSEWDSNLADYFISNSEYCDKVYPKKLLYHGPTLRTGSPRVDCLINCKEELRNIIRRRYNILPETKLVLYAPTFRGGNQKNKKQTIAEIPSIEFKRLITNLETKFNGKWKVLLKLHPQLSAQYMGMPLIEENENLLDVSQADDISEIMAACDMLITDYSSCAFDAGFAGIPVLLYADDVRKYILDRGQFMWKREELPFMIAENNDELEDNIINFNQQRYIQKMNVFMDSNGVVEDGKASKRVADVIRSYIQ